MFHFPLSATPAIKAIDALETVYSLIKQHVTRENLTKAVSATVYSIVFVGALAYHMGYALANHFGDGLIEIADSGPDDDLDQIAEEFFAPLFEAVTLAPVGFSFDDLKALPVRELRALCTSADIKWLNANGTGKSLTKAQMIGELL